MNRVVQIAALNAALVLSGSGAPSQENPARSDMRAHYDAAYRLQAAGKLDQADREHLAFLIAALARLGNGYANTGDYSKAKPTYEEALRPAPDNAEILHDYGSAALNANDNSPADAGCTRKSRRWRTNQHAGSVPSARGRRPTIAHPQ